MLGTKPILGSIRIYFKHFIKVSILFIINKILFSGIPFKHNFRKQYLKGLDVNVGMEDSAIVVDFGSFDKINTAKVHFGPELYLLKDSSFGLYVHLHNDKLVLLAQNVIDIKVCVLVR